MRAKPAAYLALIAIALAACGSRQQAGRIENLDEKNGFRGARFQTPFSEFEGLEFSQFKEGLSCFRRADEDLTVGEAQVEYIEYCFYDGRLAGVIQWGVGADTAAQLLKALRKAFGKGRRLTGRAPDGTPYPVGEMWRGKKVTATLLFVESEVNPMMDMPEVVVLLSSNELLAQRDRALGKEGKKAKR